MELKREKRENPVDAMNEIIVGLIEDNGRYRNACVFSLAQLRKVFLLLANNALTKTSTINQTKEEEVQALLNDIKDLLTNAIPRSPNE